MRAAVVALLLLAAVTAAACGGSSPAGTSATSTGAATTRVGCSDGELTMVVQQQITVLNALTTDISRDWFLTKEKQQAGIAAATAELGQLDTVAHALDACRAEASEQQAKLIEPALAADAAIRDFADATIAIAKGKSLSAAQKALRKARPEMEKLTATLTRALAALSTQWQVWQLDHKS